MFTGEETQKRFAVCVSDHLTLAKATLLSFAAGTTIIQLLHKAWIQLQKGSL